MPRKTAKQKRLERFVALTRDMKGDPALMITTENFCRKHDVPNVGDLAQKHPKVFDQMCDAIDDLVAQAPQEEAFPWNR